MTDTELAIFERIATALEQISGYMEKQRPATTATALQVIAEQLAHIAERKGATP